MTTRDPYPSSLIIGVFDDMRELPYDLCTPRTTHCKTEDDWLSWLDTVEGESAVVVLDHDLGGEAFGPETSRAGIQEMIKRHADDRIDIIIAYVVTMNPAGQRWICSELENAGIDYEVDIGGRSLRMRADEPGWTY